MITLKRLQLKNFLSYKELDLNLEDRGLVLISGENTSGKSSIPSAISWCLFGKTIKGLQGDGVINWDENQDCFVELDVSSPTDRITVRRWRLDSERGNDIEVDINDKPITGRQRDIQEVINELFRSDFKTFVNSTVFSQGMVKYLAEETDRGQREIFKKFLALREFEKAEDKAGKRLEAYRMEIAKCEQTYQTIKDKREFIKESLYRNKGWYEEYEENKQGKIRLYEEELHSLEEPAQPHLEEVDEAKFEELTAILVTEMDAKTRAQMDSGRSDGKIQQWRQDYESLQTLEGPCPLCKQDINRDTMGRHLQELQDKLRKESERMRVLRGKISDIDETIQRAQREQTTLQEVVRRTDEITHRYERAREEYRNRIGQVESKINELKIPINPFTEAIEELESQLKQLPSTTQLEKEHQELYEIILYAEFVRDLYKPKGIQAYIIENSFEFLNKKANEYLRDLTGGEISLEFVPQRKLKTGEFKEEITLKFGKLDREITYENLSDAERASTHIAIIFALHNFAIHQGVSNFNFMFLDEILDLSLDATRSENLNEILHTLSKEVNNIFVISHKEQIKNNFQNVWETSIANGESNIQNC